MAVFEELGNLLFPPRCLGCGQVLPLGEDCCENCQKIYCHLPPLGGAASVVGMALLGAVPGGDPAAEIPA